MQDYEKLGSLYLGKFTDEGSKGQNLVLLDSKDLTTHAVCVGMTGSGKTGLGIALIEETAIDGVPALIIDPKGDLGDLCLTFPKLTPDDFLPWIDESESARKGLTPLKYAADVATKWKEGLAEWGQAPTRIQKFKDAVDVTIYTPASDAGVSLAILASFAAPSSEVLEDSGALRERVLSTVTGLLGLVGINADPIKSREHILISTIIEKAWKDNNTLDLAGLIHQIQEPPFDKIGVFDVATYFPDKDRKALAMTLNHLLAAPSFQTWMEGEPLDMQHLLYTKDGKPRLAIISIAHLSDSERMFFVTLLLNEVISWMRRQKGTSSLRALLYMDEIFGYFPPTTAPPSKLPMMTLLKQGRAYGLGVVLATQNPVDLDYKGLANCGTWFIGKLQTERDRSKVLEGMKIVASGNSGHQKIEDMLAACGNRTFILRSVHLAKPELFQTRWTLSYLAGPLTSANIQSLMKSKKSLTPIRLAPTVSAATDKRSLDADVAEFFLVGDTGQPYEPYILGTAKLHFVDAKKNIDIWQERLLAAPLAASGKEALWDKALDVTSQKDKLIKQTPAKAVFSNLPSPLTQAKNYTALAKPLTATLYQNITLDIFSAPDLNMTSQPNENEGEFRSRLAMTLRERRDDMITKLRQKYEPKISVLKDRIHKAQLRLESENAQVGRRKMDTYVSIGTTILGALLGRRRLSATTIDQAGTTVRRAGRIGKEEQEAANAQEALEQAQERLQELQNALEKEIASLTTTSLSDLAVDKVGIHPRKSDITISSIALLWKMTS